MVAGPRRVYTSEQVVILATPGMSVDSEWAFSVTKLAVSSQRHRLSPEIIEEILLGIYRLRLNGQHAIKYLKVRLSGTLGSLEASESFVIYYLLLAVVIF
jgi:hypothetical protein